MSDCAAKPRCSKIRNPQSEGDNMADKRTYLILFGAQASGKGTQARMLQERFGIPQVATGDLFRANLSQGTELGQLAKSYMDRGELVPDRVTVAMVEDRLSKPNAAPGAILDGFPRNLAQAEALDAMLAKWGEGITAAVYIRLDRDRLMKRITGRRTCGNCQAIYNVESKPPKVEGVCDACGGELIQRPDDMDETAVARRLDIYFEQTTPVIEYYRGKNLLKEVDGDQSIEAVQVAIREALGEPAPKQVEVEAKPKSAVKKAAKKVAAKKAAVKKAPARKKAKVVAKKAATKKAAAKKVTRRK
jgi:adenylate kinase